jgi:uncharacterized membrane protein
MRSKASIGGHPIHPALVAIPIGAYTVTVLADLAVLAGRGPAWAAAARYALVVGIAGALLAALFGFVDFFKVTMSGPGWKVAKLHLVTNLVALALFVVSFCLRRAAPAPDHWSTAAFGVSTLAFLVLLAAGYLGGELVFKHKVGVLETDAEATELGHKDQFR